MKPISEYYGAISRCHCSNPEVPEHCRNCQCRGFVAVCLNCSGTGQTTVPVAGSSSGDMRSTCGLCGGTGKFAVKKPADWDEKHAEPVEAAKSETEEEDEEFEAMTAGAKEMPVTEIPISTSLGTWSTAKGSRREGDKSLDIEWIQTEVDPMFELIPLESWIKLTEVERNSIVSERLARWESSKAKETVEDEPKDDVELEAHTDPVRPKSIHWKKWANFTVEEKLAAVEAAKSETTELASV